MPRLKGFPCTTCGGHRLHAIRVHEYADGRLTRRRTCTACGSQDDLTAAEQSGLVCSNTDCNNIRLRAWVTRPGVKTLKVLTADGTTVLVPVGATLRTKRCPCCHHRIRTVEIPVAAFR